MLGRRVVALVLYALIQPIAAWGGYTAGFEGYRLLVGSIRRDISFGLQLHHSMIVLLVLACLNAICCAACSSWRRVRHVSLGCMLAWALFWANIFPSMPLRGVLVVGTGIVAFALPGLMRQVMAHSLERR